MSQDPEIKKIIELAPVFTILALSYSCTYLFFYYSPFNINIFQYLDISELLLISISKFVVSIVIMVLFLVISTMKIGEKKFTDKKDKLDVGHISNFVYFEYIYLFCITCTCIFFLLDKFFSIPTNLTGHMARLVLFFTPIYLSLYYIYRRKEKKQVLTVILIFFGWFSIVFAALMGFSDQKELRVYPLGNEIIQEGKSIRSTSHYYYIGHTRNYIFFYNDVTKRSDIFPASSVSSMTLK